MAVHVAQVLQAAEAVLVLGRSLAAVVAGLLVEGYCGPVEEGEVGAAGQGQGQESGGVGRLKGVALESSRDYYFVVVFLGSSVL